MAAAPERDRTAEGETAVASGSDETGRFGRRQVVAATDFCRRRSPRLHRRNPRRKIKLSFVKIKRFYRGILKGGSITVPLTSCLTVLESAV